MPSYQEVTPITEVNGKYAYVRYWPSLAPTERRILEAVLTANPKTDQASSDSKPAFSRQAITTIYGAIKDTAEITAQMSTEYVDQVLELNAGARSGVVYDFQIVVPGFLGWWFKSANVQVPTPTIPDDGTTITMAFALSGTLEMIDARSSRLLNAGLLV